MIINLIYILYVNEWLIFIQNEDCVASKSGPVALNIALFSSNTLHIIQFMKDFESLTVETAITGGRNTEYRALILSPLVTTGTVLEIALEETITVNLNHIPQFH